MKPHIILFIASGVLLYAFLAYQTYRQLSGGHHLTTTDKRVMPIVAIFWPLSFLFVILLEILGKRRRGK